MTNLVHQQCVTAFKCCDSAQGWNFRLLHCWFVSVSTQKYETNKHADHDVGLFMNKNTSCFKNIQNPNVFTPFSFSNVMNFGVLEVKLDNIMITRSILSILQTFFEQVGRLMKSHKSQKTHMCSYPQKKTQKLPKYVLLNHENKEYFHIFKLSLYLYTCTPG